MKKWLDKRNTMALVGALTLWRLYLSVRLQLHPDEAYYWLWSRHPDFSYFDHPPMVAYFIGATTLFSHSEFWVRISGTAVALLLSVLIWRLAMQLFKSVPVAAGSVMLFNVLPVTVIGLLVMTPDVPVLLFWALCVCLWWQIVQTGKAWWWYPLGVAFGMALLSKYTAVLLVPSLLIYLALSDDRRWLKTVHPYLALLIAGVCFLPVIYFNSLRDWASFAFQFNNGLGGGELSPVGVAEYVAGQLLISGPVAWPLGIYAAVAYFFRRDKPTLFLICAALPVIAVFGFSSLRKAAGPNWPAFAYFAFSILIAKFCLDGTSVLRKRLWAVAVSSSLLLSAVATLHASFNLLPLARYSPELAAADVANSFHGWRELAQELERNHSAERAVTLSHQLGAQIIYYTGSSVLARPAAHTRPSQFNQWRWAASIDGKDSLFVWTEADNPAPLLNYFSAVPKAHAFTVFRGPTPVRTYYIASGHKEPAATTSGH